MRTVELLPDEATEKAVRRAWDRLAAAGLPSQSLHPHPTNRPHVTVAVADSFRPGVEEDLGRVLAGLPVPLALEGLLTFAGSRRVLAAAVAPAPELIALHVAVHEVLDAGAEGLDRRQLPGRWMPHMTLARGLDVAQWAAAGELLADWSGPRGLAVAARSYDTATRSSAPLRVLPLEGLG